jgi:hypothetical protein
MGAPTDVVFLAAGLALCAVLGWPLCAMLPAEVKGRFWAAPVLGLSLFCVFATLAYRSGLPLRYAPLGGILCAAAAYAVPRLRRICLPRIDARAAGIAACAIAVAGLLALSPKWIGGFQFAAFQGNHYDQANYISNASAFATLSYADLADTSKTTTLANTYKTSPRNSSAPAPPSDISSRRCARPSTRRPSRPRIPISRCCRSWPSLPPCSCFARRSGLGRGPRLCSASCWRPAPISN